ncbi:MAG: DUF561 domain-containing protein [Bacteroidota bacterium]|nr:DUF561 domain-containing protein [Bacteroidota bacterium]
MNTVTEIFKIKYPIIQGGMVWCSGWKLASAVSNAGGLGLIGSGSMYPDVLRRHIKKCKQNTKNSFGVNIPLLYPDIDKHIKVIIEENVKIVFTSAGNPSNYTALLKKHGIKVGHVISNTKFALKAQQAGVDVIVAEGFEAGGHNGKEETTSMCLIPLISKIIDLPIICAGGISCGKSMAAAFALGAQGVQIGSRFAISKESSAHENFKNAVISAKEGDTKLTLKELVGVRLLKNPFYNKIQKAYNQNASVQELKDLLSVGRSKKGIFQGDTEEGELEIGQVSANIDSVLSVSDIIRNIIEEFDISVDKLQKLNI